MTETEPPSDPFLDVADTRTIVLRIQKKMVRAEVVAWGVRAISGIALGVIGWIAITAMGYAQQASIDHVRVERLEATTESTDDDVDAIRDDLDQIRQALARIEGRLERREED